MTFDKLAKLSNMEEIHGNILSDSYVIWWLQTPIGHVAKTEKLAIFQSPHKHNTDAFSHFSLTFKAAPFPQSQEVVS